MNEWCSSGKCKFNTILNTFLKEEFIEMVFDFEAKSMYTFKGTWYTWIDEKTVAKYPKICATIWAYSTSFAKIKYGGIWV